MGWSGPMTHRQFLVWRGFLRDEWNRPTRDNYYQMMIANTSLLPHVKKGSKLGFEDFRIRFGKEEDKPKVSKEVNNEMAKARWLGWVGGARVMNEKGEVVAWAGKGSAKGDALALGLKDDERVKIEGNPERPRKG